MNESSDPARPDICPVAAQRLEKVPGRSVRNQNYTEVGSLKLPEGNVRIFANRRDGSLLIAMPDQSGFLIDTAVVATQCYKYWKLHPGDGPAVPEPDETAVEPVMKLVDLNGQPLN